MHDTDLGIFQPTQTNCETVTPDHKQMGRVPRPQTDEKGDWNYGRLPGQPLTGHLCAYLPCAHVNHASVITTWSLSWTSSTFSFESKDQWYHAAPERTGSGIVSQRTPPIDRDTWPELPMIIMIAMIATQVPPEPPQSEATQDNNDVDQL